MMKKVFLLVMVLLSLFLMAGTVIAQDDFPDADIKNDDGGVVLVTGELSFTNPFFLLGVSQPIIILEDQGGFVERDRQFIFSEESQVLGRFTSSFGESPVDYTFTLPIEPTASLNDVDQNGDDDDGVMIYAVAYWTNIWGEPFLERRDQGGGGWSTAYASTVIDPVTREVEGGVYLIWAPDDEQGFPSGFGDDGLLFTEDDPIVRIPEGYTMVDMSDPDEFEFDRSREVEIDTVEPETSAATDFSDLSYTEAFDAMIEKFRSEYAFTDYKDLDWNDISDEFRPRFEDAEDDEDPVAYAFALRDFAWSIPDGHVSAGFQSELGGVLQEDFVVSTAGGLGMSLVELDDGRVLVNFILPGGPADEAGIELGAEITEINGDDIDDAIEDTRPYSLPFSTEHALRLQQLRYVIRFELDEDVEVTFANPGEDEDTVEMTTIEERQSFAFSSFFRGVTGTELPVTFSILPSGYGYAKIWSFSDDEVLTVNIWERFLRTVIDNQIPGVIIDMRQNGGGSGYLADQLAAYFFDEVTPTGYTGFYDAESDEFFFDELEDGPMIPPPEEQNLIYDGEVAVLVGPACASACEFFSYNLTIDDRAQIVGQYPTAGLGGSVEDFFMPEGGVVRFTIGRATDLDEEIHIEGIGVVPTVEVPVDEQTVFELQDPVLDFGVAALDEALGFATDEQDTGGGGAGEVVGDLVITDGGEIEVGDEIEGEIEVGERIQYTLTVDDDVTLLITAEGADDDLDTYIRVYDEDGDLITENDDVELGVQLNSRIEGLELEDGDTIIIEMATFGDASEGEFVLVVEEE
jgi:C-terminal processing protease CtpA/Prc